MLRKISIFIPFIWGIIYAASVIEVNGSKTEFDITQATPSVIHVNITTGDIVTFTEMTDDGEYTRLSLPGFHLSRDVGEPELPEIHSLIEIPQSADPQIEVVRSEYRDYLLTDLEIENQIFPAQPSLSKSQNPEDLPFVMNEEVYSKDTFLVKSYKTTFLFTFIQR